jgi:hypothetical protein
VISNNGNNNPTPIKNSGKIERYNHDEEKSNHQTISPIDTSSIALVAKNTFYESISNLPDDTIDKNNISSQQNAQFSINNLVTNLLDDQFLREKHHPKINVINESTLSKITTPSLKVLMTDRLLNNQATLIILLKEKCNIFCQDCIIEKGIDFIFDGVTAVTLLPATILRNKSNLKENIKSLSKSCFKFDKIWIIVLEDNIELTSKELTSFLYATSNFPLNMVIRYSNFENVHNVFNAIKCDALTNSSLNGITSSTYHHRPFLDFVPHPIFSSHCYFLQSFPVKSLFFLFNVIYEIF